jgi:hypothetical protein
MGNTFQDLLQLRETTHNTEHYMYRDICVMYITTVKFNELIMHSKTLPTLNKVIIKCTENYIVHSQCTFSLSCTYGSKGF